jgi:uncharacterized membrane protein YobD (UPF0266 family)
MSCGGRVVVGVGEAWLEGCFLIFKDRSMYFSGFKRSYASVENLKAPYDLMLVVVEKEMFV